MYMVWKNSKIDL